MTYPLAKGMLGMEALHDTHMLWQQNIWLYGAFSKSIIMMLLHDLYDDCVRRQQESMFLWKPLGEYGLIFSHTLHDVAGVGDGTIMVQRGYSLALEDQEVLPLWKESPIYISIMVYDFDICHLK